MRCAGATDHFPEGPRFQQLGSLLGVIEVANSGYGAGRHGPEGLLAITSGR